MATNIKVVICESDTTSAESLWIDLRRSGYEALTAFSIAKAASLIAEEQPGALLLRSQMREGSCLSFLSDLRRRSATNSLPVIVLGEKGSTEEECVRLLEAGADTFVRRPCGPKELVARLRALLRPVFRGHATEYASFETLTIDFASRSAFVCTDEGVEGKALGLAPTAFRLLWLLIESPNVVISRETIVENVWFGANVKAGAVDVQIHGLRQALKPVQRRITIETVRGAGFRLSSPKVQYKESLADDDASTRSTSDAVSTSQGKSQLHSPRAQKKQVKRRTRQMHDTPVIFSDSSSAAQKIQELHRMLITANEENRYLRSVINAARIQVGDSHTSTSRESEAPQAPFLGTTKG